VERFCLILFQFSLKFEIKCKNYFVLVTIFTIVRVKIVGLPTAGWIDGWMTIKPGLSDCLELSKNLSVKISGSFMCFLQAKG
jgi:hypothetical protein